MNFKRRNFGILSKPLFWTTLLGISFLTLSATWASDRYENAICKKAEILITNASDNHLITKEQILESIGGSSFRLYSGVEILKIDLNKIESRVKAIPYIREAQAYITMGSALCIRVQLREPKARVITPSNTQYYLDDHSARIPLSKVHTPLVPLVTPIDSAKYYAADSNYQTLDSAAFGLITAINKHPFSAALLGQLAYDRHYNWVAVPRLGNCKIEIGSLENIDQKLASLEQFYRVRMAQNAWGKYETISLQFKDQIIVKLREYEN